MPSLSTSRTEEVNIESIVVGGELTQQNEPMVSGREQISKMFEQELLSHKELDAKKIIYRSMTDKKTLNLYRELRTKLLTKSGNKNFVCMVSGLSDGSGTSHIALNIAASIGLDLSKTALLIDCNLYSPSIDKLLPFQPEYGLTNYLNDEGADVQRILYASGIPRLRVIPVGSYVESGAEYFSSERMSEFIDKIRQRYPDRFIIIDAPPVGLSTEARILSSICDVALLVMSYGKSTEAQLLEGIEAIGEEKLAGIVFNEF